MAIDPCNKFRLNVELVTQLRKFKSFINFVFDGPGSQKHSCTTRQAIPGEILWNLVDGFVVLGYHINCLHGQIVSFRKQFN